MTAAACVALGARRRATAATAFFDSAIVRHFGLRAAIFGCTTTAGAGPGPARGLKRQLSRIGRFGSRHLPLPMMAGAIVQVFQPLVLDQDQWRPLLISVRPS
jgi:hypothetical protein